MPRWISRVFAHAMLGVAIAIEVRNGGNIVEYLADTVGTLYIELYYNNAVISM